MSRQQHWESVYRTKGDAEVSWTQAQPRLSLSLIREVCPPGGRVIDVGGGASVLAERLLEAGYRVAVLDISATALERARARLGQRAGRVRWIVGDVTKLGDVTNFADATNLASATDMTDVTRVAQASDATKASAAPDPADLADLGTFDVWHDRAVFHFLTEAADRAAYATLLSRAIPLGGHAVIATFAPDGPEQCSGLPVRRYAAPALAAELAARGAAFDLIKTVPEMHITPWGKAQSFQYSLLRRMTA